MYNKIRIEEMQYNLEEASHCHSYSTLDLVLNCSESQYVPRPNDHKLQIPESLVSTCLQITSHDESHDPYALSVP